MAIWLVCAGSHGEYEQKFIQENRVYVTWDELDVDLAKLIDRPTVDKLLGAVSKFGVDKGLLVSWSGFKSNVQKELAASFFHVRLWTQKELLEQLFALYDHLDEDLKAELPLKRIWTVAAQEEE